MSTVAVFIFDVVSEHPDYVGRSVVASAWIGPRGCVGESPSAAAVRLVSENGFRIAGLIERKSVSRETLRGNLSAIDSLERALEQGSCLELYIGGEGQREDPPVDDPTP